MCFIGQTRGSVGTRAAGECFYVFSSPAAVAIEVAEEAAVQTAEGVAVAEAVVTAAVVD